MKPLNLRVILLIGGILVLTLGFQIFQRITIENFADASTPPASTPPASTPPAPTPPVNTLTPTPTPTSTPFPTPEEIGTGISVYNIPIGNNRFMKLSLPAETPTVVKTPTGPLPTPSPQIPVK